MRLPHRGLKFDRITYHANVTQCLGGLNPPGYWYLTVSKASGSVEKYPKPEDLTAFKIPPGCFVKLEMGTWHAGACLLQGNPKQACSLDEIHIASSSLHLYAHGVGGNGAVVPPVNGFMHHGACDLARHKRHAEYFTSSRLTVCAATLQF